MYVILAFWKKEFKLELKPSHCIISFTISYLIIYVNWWLVRGSLLMELGLLRDIFGTEVKDIIFTQSHLMST